MQALLQWAAINSYVGGALGWDAWLEMDDWKRAALIDWCNAQSPKKE